MRPIDADALKEDLTRFYDGEVTARDLIDEQPTVDSIMIKWTPDLDKLARDVAYRGINEFSFMGKSIREWVEIILEQMALTSWISVKDKLPQSYEYVIVAIDDDSGDSHFRYTGRGWYVPEAEFWIVDDERRTDVYAWRRFPEPPQEASVNEQN